MEKITEAEYREAMLYIRSHSGVINGLVRRIAQLEGRPILAEHVERLRWELVLYTAMRADARNRVRDWHAQRLAPLRAAREAARAVEAAARAEGRVRSQAHRTAAKRAWRHARKAALVAMIAAE